MALSKIAPATYAAEVVYPGDARTLDFLTNHHESAGKYPMSVSSALQSVKILRPEQWEATILGFEQADRAHPPPQGAVLLIGGSNARRWTDVGDYFPDRTVINRGFGGAGLADLLHFADRVVLPYYPAAIIVNAAANDLKVGTPIAARDACRAFVDKVHAKLPNTRIYQISIPPLVSALRVPERMERFVETNRLLRALADEVEGLEFIDLFPSFLTQDGVARRELYLEDGTHFSPEGYAILASLLRERL